MGGCQGAASGWEDEEAAEGGFDTGELGDGVAGWNVDGGYGDVCFVWVGGGRMADAMDRGGVFSV